MLAVAVEARSARIGPNSRTATITDTANVIDLTERGNLKARSSFDAGWVTL